jgi:transposase
MRKTYPSDVSREQFEKIRPILESARRKTKPRKLDIYDVFCAVLYLLKSGCQWSMLPSDLPKRSSVHAYFTIWKERRADESSILEEVLKKISWRGPTKQWSEQNHKSTHY